MSKDKKNKKNKITQVKFFENETFLGLQNSVNEFLFDLDDRAYVEYQSSTAMVTFEETRDKDDEFEPEPAPIPEA